MARVLAALRRARAKCCPKSAQLPCVPLLRKTAAGFVIARRKRGMGIKCRIEEEGRVWRGGVKRVADDAAADDDGDEDELCGFV